MTLENAALMTAGLIGSGVALVHGFLVNKLMLPRLNQSSGSGASAAEPIRKLIPLLLHFSTFNWFVSGLFLIDAATWFEEDAKLAVGLLVGSSYLYGAAANFWATRGRHPGWMLYTLAVVLIVVGFIQSAP